MGSSTRSVASRTLSHLAAQGVRVVSGGTDSHLSLLDLQPIGITGAEAEAAR